QSVHEAQLQTQLIAEKEMELNMTQLCDMDPILDDIKILARCISIWKSHPAGKPNEVWSLDTVLQDPQVFQWGETSKS
ncbi:hypothetical protein Tco_1325358, partial [Tanacetum coccineum]